MYKLLLVDDEDVIRAGLKNMIDKSGINLPRIFEASNGREAIEMISKYKPDIIITDIRMPYIDGLELIEWVNNNIKNKPVFVILSGYDDFDYAKRAIQYGVKDYLLKPVSKEEVIKLLNDIIEQFEGSIKQHEAELIKNIQSKEGLELLKEKYLNKLVRNSSLDEAEVVRQLLKVGVVFNFEIFKVLVIEYKSNDNAPKKLFDELHRFALKNVIDEAVSDITNNFWTFYDLNMKIVILLCSSDKFLLDTQIKKLYEHINNCLTKYLMVDTFLGAGSSVTGLMNIQNSYMEAKESAKYKIIKGPGNMMSNKDSIDGCKSHPTLTSYYMRIATEVELCVRTSISTIVDEMFKQLDFDKITVYKLAGYYNDFTRYIFDYFSEKGIDFTLVFDKGDAGFRNFDSFWSIEQLNIYIKRCLLKICDVITVHKSMIPEKKVIDQVIRYIKENYYKDINLNLVSDHFGKNNSYLSVLFKKEIGKNFIEFLTSTRIEKAKELLSNSGMKVQDIAIRVGYPNAKHFCVVFKKEVGVSPVQYKEESL